MTNATKNLTRITLTGRSEKELTNRIADNEKRGWTLHSRGVESARESWGVQVKSDNDGKHRKVISNKTYQPISKHWAIMRKVAEA